MKTATAVKAGSAHLTGLPVSGAGAQVWSRVGQMLETPFAYPELTARMCVLLRPIARDGAGRGRIRRGTGIV